MAEYRVCHIDGLSEREARAFRVENEDVVLCRLDGRVCALSGTCTHEDLPLDGGSVEDGVLTCPWHGAQYDVISGRVRALPAVRPLRTFAVRVDESGMVFVDPDA